MRLRSWIHPIICTAFAIAVSLPSARAADPGVTENSITFGQIAALDGPAKELGLGMQGGLLAAFDETNRKGGVGGRKLLLQSVDDGYEPEKMIEAIKSMVNENKVMAVLGTVGTPTAKAGQPIATEAKLPFIGPFTGAEFLRKPYNRYVVNVRASYFQETEAWIEHLTKDLGITKIAILYQDDTFGLAGLEGVKAAMAKRNMSLAAEGTFRRNTTAVKSALLEIMKARPQAVVTVGPYKPVAEFIRLSHQMKLDAVFVAISFVGADALAHELGKAGSGTIVSQVVPFPWDKTLPVVADYQSALKSSNPQSEPGFVSLEGYLVGRLVIEALSRVSGEPRREALLDAIAGSGSFNLGGITLNYDRDNNQGMNDVFFTILQPDGTYRPATQLVKLAVK